MTRRNNHHPGSALGLYASCGAWHLVKLERSDGGFYAVLEHAVSRSHKGDARDEVDRLMSILDPEDRSLPIGLALAEHGGIYRRISAPPADKTLLDKVVAAQVETMLPGRTDQVRYGWCLTRDEKSIWVHAITRPDIQEALALLPEEMKPACVISDTMALASTLIADPSSSGPAKLALSVGPRHSDVLLVHQGEIKGVITYDFGSDAICDEVGGRTDWAHWLSDARYELSSTMPPDQQPKHCLLACQPDMQDQLSGMGQQAIGLDIEVWRETGGIKLRSTRDPATVIAAHAAAACLDSNVPVVDLEERAEGSAFSRQIARHMTIAAAWLLVALLALYVSDRVRARQANNLITSGTLDQARLVQIDRQIEVARKLEMSGPIPLAIIDEIGQKTHGFMFEDFSYERGGTVRIGGLQPSADAVAKLMESLASMKTLSAVQLQSQRGDGDAIRFEITALVSPKYFGSFVHSQIKGEDKKGNASE